MCTQYPDKRSSNVAIPGRFSLLFLRPALSTLPLALKCAYHWFVIIVMRQYIPGGIVHVDSMWDRATGAVSLTTPFLAASEAEIRHPRPLFGNAKN